MATNTNATISHLIGREILDSRGNPTVEVELWLNGQHDPLPYAIESSPSGASTGVSEAVELRDGDKQRYGGKGVLKAVNNVNTLLRKALHNAPVVDIKGADKRICDADGTKLKKNLGANATTAVSFAVAVAGARLLAQPLFLHLARSYYGDKVPSRFRMPRPCFNILNGGKHAGGSLQFQEFMATPRTDVSFREGLRMVAEVYHALGNLLRAEYGAVAGHLGDEGGYAPDLETPEQAIEWIKKAIQECNYKPGVDVFLAIDPASSSFYDTKTSTYGVQRGKPSLTGDQMIEYYCQLLEKYPFIVLLEDPLAEQDYGNWIKLTARLSKSHPDLPIVGDDLYTTNTDLLSRGISERWANAMLLKVNQIGTISEAFDACRMQMAAPHGRVFVSHRSGETQSSFIADIAVAVQAFAIKSGAPARGERLAKWNRMLQIEEYLKEHNMLQD